MHAVHACADNPYPGQAELYLYHQVVLTLQLLYSMHVTPHSALLTLYTSIASHHGLDSLYRINMYTYMYR